MQSPDTDRVKLEYGWLVECAYCKQRFESKRSDATYCCANHRVAAKRQHEQFLAYVAGLHLDGEAYIRKAQENRRSKKLYEAMVNLRNQLNVALEQFEA